MTHRLLAMASGQWDTFDGWTAAQGVDPLALPFDRLLSLIYFWATKDGDPEQVERFYIRLWRPPPGETPTKGPWTAEAEMDAFRAFKAQVTG